MTVIAWDGKTLAADKLCCNGGTRNTTTKIFNHNGELFGVTGNLSIGLEVFEWYKNGQSPKDYPVGNRDEDKGASLIVVRENRTVWKFESSPVPFKCEGKFCAFGSGDFGALAAMEAGADARRAVEIVSMYLTSCGNGVDTLTLE